mmetsp:Transcript_8005/g.13878  ORF Transcript_8005/g.13878 Transcript_8005/m.13878 type:complete len:278 (+) Transcript_8005:168-1001(+)
MLIAIECGIASIDHTRVSGCARAPRTHQASVSPLCSSKGTFMKRATQDASGLRIATFTGRRPIKRAGRMSVSSSSYRSGGTVATSYDETKFITVDQIQKAAVARGLTISLNLFGPFFRVVCRVNSSDGDVHPRPEVNDDASDDATIIGIGTGFTAPFFGILHLDELRVYNSRIKSLQLDSRTTKSPFGVGLLVGAAAVRHGYDTGCRKAELLAINDNTQWHAKLVRYYTRLGFHVVREVGDNGLSDFPDLLVWGGVGTRMDADITALIDRWSQALRR